MSLDDQYELIENAVFDLDDIYIMMLLASVFFGPARMTRNVGHLRVFIYEINLEDAPQAVSVDDRARGYDVLGEWVRRSLGPETMMCLENGFDVLRRSKLSRSRIVMP